MIETLAALILAATAPVPVELASPDDCAIIVAIGKDRVGWGQAPPKTALYVDQPSDDGGVYREACPWKRYGVADPVIGTDASPGGFTVSRPTYDASRTHATASLTITVNPRFIDLWACRLVKRGGHWRLIACEEQAIT